MADENKKQMKPLVADGCGGGGCARWLRWRRRGVRDGYGGGGGAREGYGGEGYGAREGIWWTAGRRHQGATMHTGEKSKRTGESEWGRPKIRS